MLILRDVFYWIGTIIGLILFSMLLIKFIWQIKDSQTKLEKHRIIIYGIFILVALLATVSNSMIVTYGGVVIDVAMISYLYQKKREINSNKKD